MIESGILSGVRVLDLSRFIAGPLCCQMLGDMDAEIIKVESLDGEAIRSNAPFDGDRSVYSNIFNRNKRSISLNARTQGGRQILRQLAVWADVIVENYRPGVIDKMGLGFDELKDFAPGTSLISISGFGQTGPNRDRALFDATAQAETGLMSLTGSPETGPSVAGTFVVDHIAGFHGVIAVLAALRHRDATGVAQHVDVAAFDAMFTSMGIRGIWAALEGSVPGRNGARDVLSSPTDAFPCTDGYMYIQAGTTSLFQRLAMTIGREDVVNDQRFLSMRSRMENADTLTEMVTDWTKTRSRAQVEGALRIAGIPHGAVAEMSEVVTSAQVVQRGLVTTVEHPQSGTLTVFGPAMKFSETPCQIKSAPPLIGEHTAEILADTLGFSLEEISALVDAGAISTCARTGAESTD